MKNDFKILIKIDTSSITNHSQGSLIRLCTCDWIWRWQ